MNKPVKKIALVANAAKPAARRIVQRAAKLAAAAGMKPITDDGGVVFMPTFKDTLSDAQVADVAAYLKSLILQ